MTRYYDEVIQLMPRESDSGVLFTLVEGRSKSIAASVDELPDLRSQEERRTAILINGTLNHHFDIQ